MLFLRNHPKCENSAQGRDELEICKESGAIRTVCVYVSWIDNSFCSSMFSVLGENIHSLMPECGKVIFNGILIL